MPLPDWRASFRARIATCLSSGVPPGLGGLFFFLLSPGRELLLYIL